MAFSFGAPPAAASTSTSAAPTNSFSFGQSQPQQQQPPSGPSGFSFGNQNQNQQPQQQQTASSGFSFGAKPPTAIPTGPSNPTPSFSFNNNNNNSNTTTNPLNQSQPNQFSFGQSTSSQPNQPQPPQQQTQNAFNNNNNNNNSSLSTSLSVQNPNNKRLGLPLSTEIDRIRSAWDTNNLQTCRFLAYFYNSIPPQQIRAISDGLNGNGGGNQNGRNTNLSGNGAETEINYNTGRRFDAVGQRHENLWAQAVMECPDRENLLPVLALGFPDLQKRIQAQSSESIRQYQHLQTLTKRLSDLTQRHDLSNIVRIKSSANKQKELHQRLISMVRKSSKLIGSLKNSGIERKEEKLRNRLEGLEGELNGVGGGGRGGNFGNGIGVGNRGDHGNSGERLNPRINDLWASLSTAKISKAENRDGNGNGQEANLEWAMVDEDKLNEVTRILGSQQQGLSHLLKTLDSDNKSIDVVLKGLEGVGMIGR